MHQPVEPFTTGIQTLRRVTIPLPIQEVVMPPTTLDRVNRTSPRHVDAVIHLDPPPRFALSVPSSSVEHIPLRTVDQDIASAHQSKERLPLAHQSPPTNATGKAPTTDDASKLVSSDVPRGWGEGFRFPVQRQPTQEKGPDLYSDELQLKGAVASDKATTQIAVSLLLTTVDVCLNKR